MMIMTTAFLGFIALSLVITSTSKHQDYVTENQSFVISKLSPDERVLRSPIGSFTSKLLHLGEVKQSPTSVASFETSNYCNDAEYTIDFSNRLSPEVAIILKENITATGFVPLNSYHYYQVCVATHPSHHHRIDMKLDCRGSDPGRPTQEIDFNADLYISVNNHFPTVDSATWISADRGNDLISLSTYLEDFASAPQTPSGRGTILFVGVFGREVRIHGVVDPFADGVPYALEVSVKNIERRIVRSSLRGRSNERAN